MDVAGDRTHGSQRDIDGRCGDWCDVYGEFGRRHLVIRWNRRRFHREFVIPRIEIVDLEAATGRYEDGADQLSILRQQQSHVANRNRVDLPFAFEPQVVEDVPHYAGEIDESEIGRTNVAPGEVDHDFARRGHPNWSRELREVQRNVMQAIAHLGETIPALFVSSDYRPVVQLNIYAFETSFSTVIRAGNVVIAK